MELNQVFFSVIVGILVLLLLLVLWTCYEFFKLDSEQFRFYIIGLFFYFGVILSYLFRYFIFPPLTTTENAILGLATTVLPIIGVFFFIEGTEYLSLQEKTDFKRNEKIYHLSIYFVVIIAIYQFFTNILWSMLSKTTTTILSTIGGLLYFVVVYLFLRLLMDYKKAFRPPIDKIIYEYIIAVIFLIAAGVIAVIVLEPLTYGDLKFVDLSTLRTGIAFLSVFLIMIPFIICYRSVSKFRKLLAG